MPYRVHLVYSASPGIETEKGMPTVALPATYYSLETAEEAGMSALRRIGAAPGAVWYTVHDQTGRPVA